MQGRRQPLRADIARDMPSAPRTAFLHLLLLLFGAVSVLSADTPLSTYDWGTYRPNVYFGVRARHGSSPLFGLLWGGPFDDFRHLETLRHDAEERDHVTKYGWLQHDGKSFGVQEILDADKAVNLTTTFINPVSADGEVQSDRWIAHVELQPYDRQARKSVDLSLFWYIALDHNASQSLDVQKGLEAAGEDVAVHISGGVQPLRLTADLPDASSHPTSTWWEKPQKQATTTWSSPRWAGLAVTDSWNAKQHVRDLLTRSVEAQYGHLQRKGDKQEDVQRRMAESTLIGLLPNSLAPHSTLLVFQHLVTLPYALTFTLEPSDSPTLSHASIQQAVASLPARSASYAARFAAAFPLTSPWTSASHSVFAQAALANLVGGIGFFHGSSLIEVSRVVTTRDEAGKERKRRVTETKSTPALSLLSSVPSRSFFPRGFLWDEGFHQLLVGQVDLPLSLSVLSSWLSHILPSGWLPREQIPGEEARRRVPAEFQVQKPTIANPPVLVLSLGRLVTRVEDRLRSRAAASQAEVSADGSVHSTPAYDDPSLDADVARLAAFIAGVYPALQRHADWYYATQSAVAVPKEQRVGASQSLDSPATFRWAGRTLTHCLASGLDDYPRAPFIPTAKDAFRRGAKGEEAVSVLREGEAVEGHVDLHSWMIALATTMSHLASFLTRHPPSSSSPSSSLDWPALAAAYRAKAEQLLSRLDALHWSSAKQMYCDYAYYHGQHHHICHLGYITLVPLALGHVDPTSAQFRALLDHLTSAELLTPYGLRSLASSDGKFGTAEDYWRGNVWVNINYLACQALAAYAAAASTSTQPSGGGMMGWLWEGLGMGGGRVWAPEFGHLLDHMTPRRWEGGDEGMAARAYAEVRAAVVSVVYDNYERRGFLYENYNSSTGEGRGSHPFTGWTALVVNLMAEKY